MNALEFLRDSCITYAKQITNELKGPDTIELFLLNLHTFLLDDHQLKSAFVDFSRYIGGIIDP